MKICFDFWMNGVFILVMGNSNFDWIGIFGFVKWNGVLLRIFGIGFCGNVCCEVDIFYFVVNDFLDGYKLC